MSSNLFSQIGRYCSVHDAIASNGSVFIVQRRNCASFSCWINPTRSSTLICRETAGRLISKGSARTLTVVPPCANLAKMARLAGCASAANVALRMSGLFMTHYLTTTLINASVKLSGVTMRLCLAALQLIFHRNAWIVRKQSLEPR